jgi:spore germination cell wall hydrolase CwlJ-like protein
MSTKQFLFYVASVIISLFLLNTYKDNSFKKSNVVKNSEPEYVKLEYVKTEKIINPKVNKQKNCLMNALYYEARSESKLGILAVASVIENRKNSQRYPNTYCKVVNQRKQFSYTLENKPDVNKISQTLTHYDKQSYDYISKLAHKMSIGLFDTMLPETVMWYATKKVSNAWTKTKNIYATIGFHHFYHKKDK